MINNEKKNSWWRHLAYPVLGFLETRLASLGKRQNVVPVFILGPPRSGTTLFYQAFVTRFHSAYFCNYTDKHPQWPCLTSRILSGRISRYTADFDNSHGSTRGIAGPAEARKLWSNWFSYQVADHTIDSSQVANCRKVVSNVGRYIAAPFVSKNPDHCIRIGALNKTFPRAIYIRIRRNQLHVCRSIINARKNYLGSIDKWFGVRPPELNVSRNLPVWDQVAGQVHYLEQRLDDDFESVISSSRRICVEYQEFCRSPESCFKEIQVLAAMNDLQLQDKSTVPMSFRESAGQQLPDPMEANIIQSLSSLNGERYGR